ncbi:unnamed protein product [Chondrus crispus]|uniref:Uncharacterized protein n=1 Tax=Chondrus crispus TaxID=2769 RepID=R7QTU5_CHOCR|nr:unnamed protein product [Chondrus crispus]CDF40795.1 unnamed protein product [Chondrus crispus]|eukprot:XP_005711089.1 unnamed protein product [Chondrus crispus]
MTQADTAQSPVSISEEQDDELEANAPAAKLGCESTVVQRRKPKASEPLCVSTAEDAQETTDILKCIFVKLPLRDPARAARRLSRTAKKDMLEKDGTKAGPKKRPRLRSQPAKKAAKAPPPKGSSISKGKGSHPLVPKKGKASSKGNAGTKVLKPTIAKSVPPRVSRGKPVLRLKLRDRSKKVSMLEDVHTDDPPSSSHGPGIKSSQPKQTLIPAGNTTAGDAPCREPALEVEKEVRRSARVTRDAPTLEQILGSGNTRAPIMPPEDLLSKMRKLKCSLCLSSIEIGDQKKHPFFQIRSLHLCETCQDHISTSSHAFAAISSGALSGEHCGPWKQSSALAFVTEGLVRNLRPSERRKAELTAAHDRIVLQSKESVGKRVEALSVPLEMIAIIQLLLLEIGVAFKAGGMVWPEGTISLPENDDTRSMISNVLPLSLDDIRSGRSAGERAWESVFGENERCASLTSCAIFGKVLDLVGVATEHVGGCGGNTSDGSGKCCVRVDQTSVKAVSSWASKSSTAAQRIFKERPDDVTEEHLGHHEICCVCILPLVPATFPFRYSKCGGCRKTFCSVCLSNVLGSSEYVRALCEDSYSCVGCRWKQKQSFLAKGQWGLKSISSTKKTTTVTEDRRSTLPLLLLSSPIRKKLHQVRNHKKLQFEIRFAQLCDSLNYQGCTSHVRDKGCSPKPICFQCCSLDSDDTGTESTESGISRAPFVTCSGKKCSTVMHRHCVEGYKPSKTRGRSGMVCKQHKCSVCAGRDETRLVRCRTCPVTYCRDHAPPAPDIHIYSDKFIACPTCKPYLHFPRMSTQRPPPLPKRISHANNIAISFALDQRQRQAVADRAVSKLYDGEDKMSATSIERGDVFDLHRTCFRKV